MDNQNLPNTGYAPYNPVFQPIAKRVYEPLDKKDSRFLPLLFICAAVFSDFALFKGFHLGFTISFYLIFAAATAYLWNKEKKIGVFPIFCGLISLAGAVTFSLFSHIFINAIMLILIAGLFTVYCIGISGAFSHKTGNFKMLFDLASAASVEPLESVNEVVQSIKAGAKKGNKSFSGLIGAVLAVPVLFIIVPLLVKSDAAFEGLVTGAVKNTWIYAAELVAALVITAYAYCFMYSKRHKKVLAEQSERSITRRFPASGSVSFLSVISIVYVIYLFSQLAYFFSAFKGILPEGYTHSASVFARRGFFEMFAVCAINIALISVVSAFTKRQKGKTSNAVKALSLFISLFSVLMLAVSMQKMRLNIATYGYSRNRLLVCAFMLMMLVVLAFFIIHIFAPKVPYMQTIIIVCSVIFVALSFADVNRMTAEYNSGAYLNGKLGSANVEYYEELGDSAVPSLVKLTVADDRETAAKADILLAKFAAENRTVELKKGKGLKAKKTDFREYALVRENAAEALEVYYSSLDDVHRKAFEEKYNFFKSYEVSYYEDSGDYYSWENDSGYVYNKTSGEFEYTTNLDDVI